MTLWAAGIVVLLVRGVGHAELVRVWSRLAVVIILGSHLACIALIWGIMPFVPAPLQLLMALPLIGCVPVQLICSPENSWANRIGVVGVIGSLGLFFATRGTEVATFAALYIFGFGVVMLVLGDRVAGTVRTAVAARLASDAAARQLDRMFGEVAAQRDAKTKFIAAASHDLGQPLAAAALFFDQSLRAHRRPRPRQGGRRRAPRAGVAEQLLSHMLGHLRLEADAVEPHRSHVAVRPLLARVAAQHEPAARAAGIDAARRRCDRSALRLDPSLAERAVGNLVGNAIQHSRGTRAAARRPAARRPRPAVGDRRWRRRRRRSTRAHIFDDYYQGQRGGGTQSDRLRPRPVVGSPARRR